MEILSFFIAMVVLYIVLKILTVPVKIIIKLLINAFVGGLVLFVINLIGASFGFTIAITWLTSLIVGFLGVPGVIIVILMTIL